MAQETPLEILSKFQMGDLELRNRLILAPMTRARCTPSDKGWLDPITFIPNDIIAEYYAQRAGDAGLLVTEGVAISELGSGWPGAPHIRNAEQVEGWKRTVDAVHAKDGYIFLQLWHIGRQSHSSFHPSTGKIAAPSAIAVKHGHAKTLLEENVPYEVPTALTVEEIKETVQDFVRAAQLSKEAGFDGVEIHGANGYLIDTFLQSSTNIRQDEYGGSPENRVRFLTEIVEALIAESGFPANRIGVKLSPNGNYGDMGSPDNDTMFPYVAQVLSQYGLAYLHLMDGLGFGYHGQCRVVRAMEMKQNFKGPLMANIGLTKDMAEGMVRSGSTDLVSFGRLYISNPDLAARFEHKWPVIEDPPYETWWQHTGAKGFTDWPFYQDEKKEN